VQKSDTLTIIINEGGEKKIKRRTQLVDVHRSKILGQQMWDPQVAYLV